MATLNYDLVVLGDDFAGLVTACLCATRGMRVLLAHIDEPRESYRFDDESLPIEPIFLSGLQSPAAERVIEELHFQHLFKRRLHPLEPACQLLAPNLRLEVDTDKLRFSQSLQRELGADNGWLLAAEEAQANFPELLTTDACIPPSGFWERREVAKLLDPIHERSESWLAEAHSNEAELLSDLALCGELGAIPEHAFSRARSLVTLRHGLAELDGDREAWHSIFIDKFKSHNGQVRRVLPQALDMSWGKVTGLKTLEDHISCDFLVSALPVGELLPLFGNKPPRRLQELTEQVVPSAFRYTLNLLVHMNGLPEGMGQIAWSQLYPGQPPTGGNFASFSTRAAAQSGRAIVTMQGLVEVDQDGAPKLQGMREAMLDHARERMPFLDMHLEACDSPHAPPADGHTRELGHPLPPAPVWQCPEDATLKLPALPYLTGVKHLCLANAQTLPFLGLQGQFIAGWSAAKLASASMGKRKAPVKTSVLAQGR